MPTSSEPRPKPKPAIEIRGLGKRYALGEEHTSTQLREVISSVGRDPMRALRSLLPGGRERPTIWALRDLDLAVPRGEVLGVVGANGAGKTTLLRLLSRITEPTTGRFTLRGRCASLLAVGTGFHPELTGRENVYLSGTILGMRKREIDARFDDIVSFAGVATFVDTPVKRYSSGMYVRLGFAVAAHLDAEILLVDEVLAVGDAAFRKRCLGAMGDAARSGRTVVFVSHDLGAVQRLCDRVVLLERGRLRVEGLPADVIRTYLHTEDQPSFRAAADPERPTITGVDIVDAGGAPLLRPGALDPLGVDVRFALPQPVAGTSVEVTLSTANASPIVSTSSAEAGLAVPASAGEHRMRVVFPADLLLPGDLQVGVVLRDDRGLALDRREPALACALVPRSAPPLGAGVPRRGMLRVPSTWTLLDRV